MYVEKVEKKGRTAELHGHRVVDGFTAEAWS
jgi:hypothetical protein